MTWRGHSCLRRRDSSRRSGTVDAAHEEGRDESKFGMSPRVGQAVLAFARFYPSSGPKFSAGGAGEHRLPHLRSSRHRKEWLSPFSPPG
jgi:hypothetical protein